MTHSDPAAASADPAVALAKFLAEAQEKRALEATVLPDNKAALFDGLRLVGIAHVTVRFDGYGDSGQIEEIDARNEAGAPVDLPEARIVVSDIDWESREPVQRPVPLHQAIEEMVYDFLSDTHGGWENCDGAYGEFCFDARARTIHLDYNERFTSSELFTHEF